MTTLHRAYSLLEVREFSDDIEHYTIKGVATTPTPDRYLDEIDPLGATYADSIPLLWQHSSQKPVGITTLGKATKKGIPYTAQMPKVAEEGVLRERIEEAVQSIRYKLVAAVSIGFRVLEDGLELMANGGIRFLRTEILELSLVTIPANADATIESIKALDSQQRAALGFALRKSVRLISAPGVSGNTVVKRGGVKLITRGNSS